MIKLPHFQIAVIHWFVVDEIMSVPEYPRAKLCVIFPQRSENTTKGKQYSKALRKHLMKNPPNFKPCR